MVGRPSWRVGRFPGGLELGLKFMLGLDLGLEFELVYGLGFCFWLG